MNMDTINGSSKDRLLQFLDYLGVGQTKFESNTGISRGYINKLKGSIGAGTLNKISTIYPNLNIDYIISGQGDMILKHEVSPVPESDYMMAEYVDLSTAAGKIGGSNVDLLNETHKRLVPKEYEYGNYLVVRVDGDSMNDGTLRSIVDGDEVLVKEEKTNNGYDLPIKTHVFVIVSREGTVIKQITEINREERYIICHSFNPAVHDYKIYFDDILQIFKACKFVQKQIRLF